ncbi:MAG: tRNA pseudouridine(55) synthase TruB [Endozoicomonadaceae bacterium]|nr:tRNA pseudouridine(55) synthase TruB [Endozoicomonadaceae bacterium]
MTRHNSKRAVNGFLIVDKPAGVSSNGVLQQVKRLFNAKKAGHTGSLDPLATGVLPVCFGEATKLSQYLLDADKAYLATATLGIKTTTGDSEGSVISEKPVTATTDAIENMLPQFTGCIQQIPPMYSALKHKGQPLYKLAREGKQIERKPREITIHEFKLLSYTKPYAQFYIKCTKGTYVRTLIEDLGEALGCEAHISALRRTQAGSCQETQSYTPEQLQQIHAEKGTEALDKLILPPENGILHLPKLLAGKTAVVHIRQGNPVALPQTPLSGFVRLYSDNRFIGIGSVTDDGKVAMQRAIKH